MTEVSKLLLSLKPGQVVYRTGVEVNGNIIPGLSLNSMTDRTNPFVINPVALQKWTQPFEEHDPMIYYGEGKAKLSTLHYREVVEENIVERYVEDIFIFLHHFNNATYQFSFSKSCHYAENFHVLFYIL